MNPILPILAAAAIALPAAAQNEQKTIRIATDNTDLILQVAPNGRLYQTYL